MTGDADQGSLGTNVPTVFGPAMFCSRGPSTQSWPDGALQWDRRATKNLAKLEFNSLAYFQLEEIGDSGAAATQTILAVLSNQGRCSRSKSIHSPEARMTVKWNSTSGMNQDCCADTA
jgi:hypothetical protein